MEDRTLESLLPFVLALASGGGDFYDGFRPVSFLLEAFE